jgi:adenylate cyclase class IV
VSSTTAFKEIEHKFVVDATFDRETFLSHLRAMSPLKMANIKVRDTYYVLAGDRNHVFRHRFDDEIQQLTVKSIETDTAVRTEINLPIDQSKGDQGPSVLAFMNALGCAWQGEIRKEISVAYFPDCEVVFYRAVGSLKTVHCVEFEAVTPTSVQDGLATLSKYELALGFASRQRESKSLFELVLLDSAPSDVRQIFK